MGKQIMEDMPFHSTRDAGLIGKKGGEAINVHINKLERSYWGYLIMSCDRLRTFLMNIL